ncbi:MAG: hypothetical protein WCF18_11095 [Chthoniobacteraceae bacterium]
MQIDLKQLLDRLDDIRKEHPELASADVRRALVAVIYHGFIMRVPGYSVPESLGMTSPGGNAAVRIALAEFLDATTNSSARTPVQRFAAFQNPTVESDAGHCYAEYFGYTPSFERLAATTPRPVAVSAAPPKSAGPWWQFWKQSHPRAS